VITASLHSFLSFLLPFSVRWFYAFSLFALPRSLSLSLSLFLSLSCSLSLYLIIFFSLLLLLAPSATPATCFTHPHDR
jgi:hypothetical protein